MESEKLLQAKPNGKKGNEQCCILCNEACPENEFIKDEVAWNNLKRHSENWVGLDKFGTAYDSTSWEDGPLGKAVHTNCRKYIATKKALNSAKKRNEDEMMNEEASTASPAPIETVRLRRSEGKIHSPHLCVWCMKPKDDRHKGRKSSQLHIINQVKSITVQNYTGSQSFS